MSVSFTGWQDSLPVFRTDLQILRKVGVGGRRTMHYVRDPKTYETFEFGEEGAFICRQLDGKTGPEAIRRQFRARFDVALEQEDLDVFLEQLAHKGMLAGVPAGPRLRTVPEAFDPEVFLPWFKIRVMSGDRLVAFLARHLWWLFTWPTHVVLLSVLLWGVSIFVLHFSEIFFAVSRGLTLNFFLLLTLTSCLLVQSPRLFLHGIMAKRYGRQVGEVGISFLYYVLPIVYCDWSDVVWVGDKRKRFYGIAAGLYYQIILWSVATIGWFVTRPGGNANTFFLNITFAVSLGFFLFNANPLVKMNGYLLLVNWIEVPRLRERALAAFGAWMMLRKPSEVFTARERRWFIVYGLLVFIYALLHLGLIAYLFWGNLTPLYEGRGALASVLLLLFVMHKPIVEALGHTAPVKWLLDPRGGVLRWTVRLGIPAALLGSLFLPYPYRTGGAFQFLPAARAAVRVEVEGQIEAVLVREGEFVHAGQPIVRLAARDHEKNLAAARARLEKSRSQLLLLEAGPKPEDIATAEAEVHTAQINVASSAEDAQRAVVMFKENLLSRQGYENVIAERDLAASRLREAEANLALVRSGPRPEELSAQRAEVASLQAVVDDYQVDVERTTLYSPIDGRVVTPRIEQLVGTYLKPGENDLVAEIEDGRTIRAEVAVPEQDLAFVHPGQPVELVPWGFHDTAFIGQVTTIAPVLVSGLQDLGADASAGDQKTISVAGTGASSSRKGRVITEIPNPAESLKTDMTGYAKIPIGERPVWDVLFRPLARWVMVEVWSWVP